jgi:serine/threonine protein kinase
MSTLPTIPGFKIQRVLSEGRRSVLYLAEQESLQRLVALKVLTGEMTADERSRKRLIEQEKSAARLTHPNLIAVYDISEFSGQPYIATEYVTGGTLRETLGRGALSFDRALQVAHDLCQGLVFLHAQGLLHRDIKPTNVLFREDGTAVLGASGITRIEDTATMDVSFGSPHYMSPEQAQAQAVDGRSDLYSLGVVMFEMLAGHLPFDSDDPFQVAIKHISEPVPAMPSHLAKLQPLVHRLLAKRPEERFANAQQLLQVLDQALTKMGAQRGQSAPQPRAAPETLVQAPIKPVAQDLGATVVAAPLPPANPAQGAQDLGATVVSAPLPKAETSDLGATMVAAPLPNPAAASDVGATMVAAPITKSATQSSAPLDVGATMVSAPVARSATQTDVGATMVSGAIAPPVLPTAPPPVYEAAASEGPRYNIEAFEETPKKSKAPLVIGLILLLAIAGGVAWWFLRAKPAPTISVPKPAASQLGGSANMDAQPAAAATASGATGLDDLISRGNAELARARAGDMGALAAVDGSSADSNTALALFTQAEKMAPNDPRARAGRADAIQLIVQNVEAMKSSQASMARALVEAALLSQPDNAELQGYLKQLQ